MTSLSAFGGWMIQLRASLGHFWPCENRNAQQQHQSGSTSNRGTPSTPSRNHPLKATSSETSAVQVLISALTHPWGARTVAVHVFDGVLPPFATAGKRRLHRQCLRRELVSAFLRTMRRTSSTECCHLCYGWETAAPETVIAVVHFQVAGFSPRLP